MIDSPAPMKLGRSDSDNRRVRVGIANMMGLIEDYTISYSMMMIHISKWKTIYKGTTSQAIALRDYENLPQGCLFASSNGQESGWHMT
jgi:hypothetical protein